MGRRARNKQADAVMMFWHSLSTPDKLEVAIEMMRYLALGSVGANPEVKAKRAKKSEEMPIQSQAAPF